MLGLGIGMAMPNLTNAIQNAVAYNELGAATGAMVFIRSLGGALGVAASGAILSARLAAARATGHFPTLNAHSIRALASLPRRTTHRHRTSLPHRALREFPALRCGYDRGFPARAQPAGNQTAD